MQTRRRTTLALQVVALILLCAALMPACAARIEPTQPLAVGAYPAVFQAARDVLRDERFALDRVDARAGVISTQPATVHVRGATDVIDRVQRVARIEFTPSGGAVDSTAADLRETAAPLTMKVRVFVERVYYPGLRPSPVSARLSTRHDDPDLAARQLQPAHAVTAREDEDFARELAAKIMARAGMNRPADPGAPAPTPPAKP